MVGIVLTAAARMVASESPSTSPVEYLVISVPAGPEDLQRELNRRGGEGWEFVNATRTALGEALVLKRPKK
jgi:hypothetical protein